MNWRVVLRLQGYLLMILAGMMIFPLIFSIYGKSGDIQALSNAFLLTLFSGVTLALIFHRSEGLRAREGFVTVTLGWILASLYGALPFFFHGSFGGYINCVFEAMSGFTTTGATILTNIEIIPKGLLFWRSLTHWIGGMGIILLTIALLPFLGLNPGQLYNAEVPGPAKDRVSPKIQDTAKILWGIYLGMTLLETVLLMFGGMSLYDALCHTFGTLATGGFSTRNASVGAYHSVYIELVILFFMYLAGINFSLHFQLIQGNFKSWWKNSEWKLYTLMVLVSILLVSLNLFFSKDPQLSVYHFFPRALRDAAFQVVSIITTTGFTTTDFNLWPSFSALLLIFLMFAGGSSGSTGGGMKQVRVIILFKVAGREIRHLFYPKGVFEIRLGNEAVSNGLVRNIFGFFVLFMGTFAFVTLFLAFRGYDIVTSFSASIATLGNIGPGLARVGAIENYAFFDPASKLVLIFSMLSGRLELYSVFVFLYALFRKHA